MKKPFFLVTPLLVVAGYLCLLFFTLPFAMVTVKVLDEAGNPVPDATVGFTFVDKLRSTWGNLAGYSVKTVTNAGGYASEFGPTEGTLPCGVHKDGYYDGGPWVPPSSDLNFFLHVWLPWNPKCEVVLRKIINPVPMYAKPVRLVIPTNDQPVGFDLTVGDWVAPFGKGVTSDFLIQIFYASQDRQHFILKAVISFSNKGDGLQVIQKNTSEQGSSAFSFPRRAPLAGYTDNFTKVVSDDGTAYREEHAYDLGYFFRVRTVESTQGAIESAYYGKIRGPISTFVAGTKNFNVSGDPGIEFTYYLNPDGTTNMEAAPSHNLFKNLDELEAIRVHYP